MSRDALLIILAIVVIANFVFLAEVAVLNRRRTARERADARNAAAGVADVAVAAAAGAAGPRAAPAPAGPEGGEPLGPRLVPAEAASTPAATNAVEAMAAGTEPEAA